MRRLSPLLLLSAGLLAACAPPEQPSVEAPPVTRAQGIRNGTRDPASVELTDGELLAIGWLHRPGVPSGNFCTGTLISPRVVVTAEHCTDGEPPDRFAFGIGLLPSDPVASFSVIEIIEHPQVDAALLILGQDAVARVPQLEPIQFNRATLTGQHQGMTVEASGYGETFDPTRDGRWFATLELETVGERYVVVNGNGTRGICFGDSGGPLLAMNTDGRPVVLAVESNGEESCVGRDNMTRLDVLGSWIEPIAEDPGSSATIDGASNNPCRQLDYLGRCNGAQAEWCEDGQFKARDCSSDALGCGFVSDDLGYYCIDPNDETGRDDEPDPGPECTSDDTWCDGDDRISCEGGAFVRQRCAAAGATCSFTAAGTPACLDASGNNLNPDPDPPDPDVGNPDEPGFTDDGPKRFSGDPTLTSRCSASPGTPNAAPLLLGALALGLGLLRRR